MKIVGCDLHARQQTIAMVDTETGEFTTKTLSHEGNAVRAFYAALEGPVVVGIEATGSMQWFLELLEELGIQCRVGHPAKIRAKETRKQKHDRRDAGLIWELLLEDRFPEIWMPSTEQRDLRTLLRDRHQWVKMRARLQHTLQAIALNHALRQGRALWSAAGQSALQALPLPPYTDQRRTALLRLYVQLQKRIQELDQEVEAQAGQRPQARRLLTHPGVGPVTALATEVFLGDPSRFATANQVASYIGMIPCEHSSGKRQRLGKLTKQGNSLLRYLWTEATLHAVQKDPELKRFYRRKLIQKGMGKARIAAARKLGIRLWIMIRAADVYHSVHDRRRSNHAPACMKFPSEHVESWHPGSTVNASMLQIATEHLRILREGPTTTGKNRQTHPCEASFHINLPPQNLYSLGKETSVTLVTRAARDGVPDNPRTAHLTRSCHQNLLAMRVHPAGTIGTDKGRPYSG